MFFMCCGFQGGLRVDSHARVLRIDGSIISGLYAGGGTAAGLSGNGVQVRCLGEQYLFP